MACKKKRRRRRERERLAYRPKSSRAPRPKRWSQGSASTWQVPSTILATAISPLAEAGVEIHWQTEPTSWNAAGNRVESIETNEGTITGDEFVLAAGVWSSSVARQLGVNVPMQAGKGYSVTLQTPPRLPAICAILSEARVAVTPMGTSLRVGGTMEVTSTPAGIDTTISPKRVRGITRAMTEYFPDFQTADFRDAPVWSGLRPCSPDGMPYIGRFGRYTNLSAATGHSMMGVSLAPITGKIMAEILSGQEPSIDIRALSPDRYN